MSDEMKAHCNKCGGETNHATLAVEDKIDRDADEGLHRETFELLKCRGCGTMTMRHTGYFSEVADDCFVVQYPPATARRVPSWLTHPINNLVPDALHDLMFEVYAAAQNHLRQLVGMGIRAALDMIMVDKVGDCGTFDDKLDAMAKHFYISLRQKHTLEAIINAGNASTHRGWVPRDEDIATLFDITENLIDVVYIHEELAKTIELNVPPRAMRGRRPTDTK